MTDNKESLEAMIDGKRLKQFLCRKNSMKVETCEKCKLFYSCSKVLDEALMKRHYRVLFKKEPPNYFRNKKNNNNER